MELNRVYSIGGSWVEYRIVCCIAYIDFYETSNAFSVYGFRLKLGQ